MPKLHVLLNKKEVDPARLAGKVVIVLDILFATSTIVHAFAQGVARVWPARDADGARRIAAALDAPMLAGEYLGERLPGFGPPTPVALAATGLRGATLVYATTNGTLAFDDVAGAAHVYAGALGNGAAVVAHVVREHPQADVLLLCSGSMDRFNLEDFYGAGHLASHFEATGRYQSSDAALAALLLHRGCDTHTALYRSRVGQALAARDLQHEIGRAAETDTLQVVPELIDGCLRLQAA